MIILIEKDNIAQAAFKGSSREAKKLGIKAGTAYGYIGFLASAFSANPSIVRRNMQIIAQGAGKFSQEIAKGLGEITQKTGSDQTKVVRESQKQAEKQFQKEQVNEDKRTKKLIDNTNKIEEKSRKSREKMKEELVKSAGPEKGFSWDAAATGGAVGYLASGLRNVRSEVAGTEEIFSNFSDKVMSTLGLTRREAREFWRVSASDMKELNKELGRAYFGAGEMKEALTSAMKTGVVNLETMKEMTKAILIAGKIMPEIDWVSYGMFREVIDLYEEGTETMLGITEKARALSQTFWVDPDVLVKTADQFHRHVKGMARTGKDYEKIMGSLMTTVAVLEDAFLDSQKIIQPLIDQAMKPIHQWGKDDFVYYSRLGLNARDFQMEMLRDPGSAIITQQEAQHQYFQRLGFFDELGKMNELSDQQLRHLIYQGDLIGMTYPEITHFMENFHEVREKSQKKLEEEKKWQERIRDNTFLGIVDHLKNLVTSNLAASKIMSGIHAGLDNMGLTLEQVLLMSIALKGSIKGSIVPAFKWLMAGGLKKLLLVTLPSTIGASLGKLGGLFGLGGAKAGATVAGAAAAKGGLAVGLASNPVGWAIAAILAFGIAIWQIVKHWDKIRPHLDFFFDGVKQSWNEIKEAFRPVKESLKALWEDLKPLRETFKELQKLAGEKVLQEMTKGIVRSAKVLLFFIKLLVPVIESSAKTFVGYVNVARYFIRMFDKVFGKEGFFTNLWGEDGIITRFFTITVPKVFIPFVSIVGKIGKIFTDAFDKIAGVIKAIQNVIEGIQEWWENTIFGKAQQVISGEDSKFQLVRDDSLLGKWLQDRQSKDTGSSPSGGGLNELFEQSAFNRISSPYGTPRSRYGYHRGVDLSASHGVPIPATASGNVWFAGNRGTYGNVAMIEDERGFTHVYAHMHGSPFVRKGDWVDKGEVVGLVGSSGGNWGSHLHYEVRKNRQWKTDVDPMPWVPALLGGAVGYIDKSSAVMGEQLDYGRSEVVETGRLQMSSGLQQNVWGKAMSRTGSGYPIGAGYGDVPDSSKVANISLLKTSMPSYTSVSAVRNNIFSIFGDDDLGDVIESIERGVGALINKMEDLKANAEIVKRMENRKKPDWVDLS